MKTSVGRWAFGLVAACAASLAGAQVAGPDVTLLDFSSTTNFGAVGGIRGYAIASSTCNMGTSNLTWASNGTPALGMNAYRLHNGRLTQIGLGFCKMACCAAAGSGCGISCNGSGGSVLGAGCLDVYGSSYNGGQNRLCPRSAINAWTGQMTSFSTASGDAIFKRLQIAQTDLTATLFPGALYFFEGVYVGTDDAQNGNHNNNATYRRVLVDQATFNCNPTGTAVTQVPAIRAWRDHGGGANVVDPNVHVFTADVPGEGRFWVAHKVTPQGNGQWLYDYAIYNLSSDRAGASFTVPLNGALSSEYGLNAPRYHSGEPASYNNTWRAGSEGCNASFLAPQTYAENANGSAIRWGAMYNFWFKASAPPVMGTATLGLFKPGTPSSIELAVQVPAEVYCDPDYDGNGIADQDDVNRLIHLIAGGTGFTCKNLDFNRDGIADQTDVDALIDRIAGGECP